MRKSITVLLLCDLHRFMILNIIIRRGRHWGTKTLLSLVLTSCPPPLFICLILGDQTIVSKLPGYLHPFCEM